MKPFFRRLLYPSLPIIAACLVWSARAQTPANQSFEANVWSPGIQTLVGAGAVNSWTYNANGSSGLGVVESSPYGPTPFGSQFIVLNGSGANQAYVEQTISGFTPGWVYRLSFSISSEAGGVGNTPPASRPLSRIGVTLTGATNIGTAIFTADRRGSGVWDTWICQEMMLEATASSVTFRFEHVDPSPLFTLNGVGLDNVQICNVTAGICPPVECQPFPPSPFPLQCGMAVATYYSGFDINIGVITTNSVLAAVDLRNPALNAMLGQNWFCPMFHNETALYATNRWTAANLGQVFGVTLDDASPPNIYVTATTIYNVQPGGPGGPGAVYKINGVNGNVTQFAILPNGIMSNPKQLRVGPALGNICFDPVTQKFFVSDLEDGKIYVLDTSGNVAFTYDHGVNGRPVQGYSVIADDGIVGAATQSDRQTWGVQVDGGKLYYSVGTDLTNDVWSLYLMPNGQPNAGTAAKEFTVPPYGWPMFSTISSIDLSCNRMLLAERSTGFMGPHTSRLLEYQKTGNTWSLIQSYNTSTFPFATSASGGADISCDGTIWATSDRLICTNPPPGLVYGLINIFPANYNPNNPPGGAYNIDLNGVLSGFDKHGIGDVELCNCGCMSIGAQNVICTNGVFVWSFTVTNNSAFTWSSLALTNLPGGVTISPASPLPLSPVLLPGGTRTLQWTFNAPGYAVSLLNFLLRGLPSSGPEFCELAHCIQLPEACCPNIVLTNYVQCLTNAANSNVWHLTLTNSIGTNITGITIGAQSGCVSLPGGPFYALTNFPANTITNLNIPIVVSSGCGTNLCFTIAISGPQTNYLCDMTHCIQFTCVASNRCPLLVIPTTFISTCASNLTTSFTAIAEDLDFDPLEIVWFTNGVAFATNQIVSGETNDSPVVTFALGKPTGAVSIWDRRCPPIYYNLQISVGDFEPPTVSCPTQLVEFHDLSAVVPDFTPFASVSDNCTPSNQIVITQFPAPGTILGPGLRNAFVRASDTSGNTNAFHIIMKIGTTSLQVDPAGEPYTNSATSFHLYDQPTNLTFTLLGDITNTDIVTFYVSGNPIGVVSNPPYAATWTPPAGAGLYDAWAVAKRPVSLVSTSAHLYLSFIARPTLNISLNPSNQAVLNWTAPDYILMTAPQLDGSWTDIPGATAPHSVALTNSQLFFRLRSQ